MAKGNNSSKKKRRNKRTCLAFRTPKEKKQLEEKRQLKLKQNSASLLTPSKHTEDSSSAPSTSKTADRDIAISTPKISQAKKLHRVSDDSSSSKENSTEIPMVQNNRDSENIVSTTQGKTTISKATNSKATKSKATKSKATKSKADTLKGKGQKTPQNAQVKQTEEIKEKTHTKRRKRQSINFVAPKDKKPIIRDQSVTGHVLTRGSNSNTNASAFGISASSISRLSETDTPGLAERRLDGRASQSMKDSIGSPVQRSTSQKRKLTGDEVPSTAGAQAKKRKTSKKASPNNTSLTLVASPSTKGKRTSKRSPASGFRPSLDRIRDLKVTKKSFEKWKPMSKVTIAFVENVLKSVIKNVSADGNFPKDEDTGRCLGMLENMVMERLPKLKAPYTKGDYRNMESENEIFEANYIRKRRGLSALDKEIEEGQRLLETQTALVAEFTTKREEYEAKLALVEKEKTHPLIAQTKNVLKVSQLRDDFHIEDEAPLKKSKIEKHLCRTLLDLRRKTKEIGLEKWMNKLADFTSNCV